MKPTDPSAPTPGAHLAGIEPDAVSGKVAPPARFHAAGVSRASLTPAWRHRAATRRPKVSRRLEEPCAGRTTNAAPSPPPVDVVEPLRCKSDRPASSVSTPKTPPYFYASYFSP